MFKCFIVSVFKCRGERLFALKDWVPRCIVIVILNLPTGRQA